MSDEYYVDYRIGEIVKNLDTRFMAPELYNEVEIDDNLDETYKYTYSNSKGEYLDFIFSMEEIQNSDVSFQDMLDIHFDKHSFTMNTLVRKVMYLSQEKFNQFYEGD